MFLFKNRFLLVITFLSFTIIAAGLATAFVYFTDPTTPLIIHFSAEKGIDFLGNRSHVFGILGTGLFFVLLNTVLAEILWKKLAILSHILLSSNLLISLLIIINLFSIITVN